MKRKLAIDAILVERVRQNGLKRAGKFPWTCADEAPSSAKYCVLAEEVGEVARALNDGNPDNLKDELVQVAAVCLAWLEAL